MGRSRKFGKRRVREVAVECRGNISAMAEKLETSRPTIYDNLDHYELWDVIEAGREQLVKLSERIIVNAIEDGDIKTAMWVLSRLGKDRGWTTRGEDGAIVVSKTLLELLGKKGQTVHSVLDELEAMLREEDTEGN